MEARHAAVDAPVIAVDFPHRHLEDDQRAQAGRSDGPQETPQSVQLGLLPAQPRPHVDRLNRTEPPQRFAQKDRRVESAARQDADGRPSRRGGTGGRAPPGAGRGTTQGRGSLMRGHQKKNEHLSWSSFLQSV